MVAKQQQNQQFTAVPANQISQFPALQAPPQQVAPISTTTGVTAATGIGSDNTSTVTSIPSKTESGSEHAVG